jgi:dTDP-4-dehydrorhamnose reductase
MKIIVTGSRGMLGTDMMQMLPSKHEVLGCDLHNCNILDYDALEQFVLAYHPEIVIHAAAYTNVDQAETDQEVALKLNETGTRYVANATKNSHAKLVYISTDYVFDGTKGSPYTEEDPPHPLGVYGKTKLRGEQQVQQIFGDQDYLIIRTSWLYGRHGENFVQTILRCARKQKMLRIVNDQTGSPTYTKDLVRGIMTLLEQNMSGIMHLANTGYCTWYEFGKTILELSQMSYVAVEPISAAELQRPAPRPAFSVLDISKFVALTGEKIRHWKQGLQEYLFE